MLSGLAGERRVLQDIPNYLEKEDVCIAAEWRVTEFGQTESLSSLSGPATEALAQPSSRPRRVPGWPVAGDWEQSPLGLGPCAGTAKEREAPAAVAQLLGQCLPRRPFWALGLALSVRT